MYMRLACCQKRHGWLSIFACGSTKPGYVSKSALHANVRRSEKRYTVSCKQFIESSKKQNAASDCKLDV